MGLSFNARARFNVLAFKLHWGFPTPLPLRMFPVYPLFAVEVEAGVGNQLNLVNKLPVCNRRQFERLTGCRKPRSTFTVRNITPAS